MVMVVIVHLRCLPGYHAIEMAFPTGNAVVQTLNATLTMQTSELERAERFC
jgi:hypothetical protein